MWDEHEAHFAGILKPISLIMPWLESGDRLHGWDLLRYVRLLSNAQYTA